MKNSRGKTASGFPVLALAALAAVLVGAQAGSEVLARLKVSPTTAQEAMLDALSSGNAYNDAAQMAFKALAPAARAEVVRAGLAWVKANVDSADFKAAYAKLREDEKPSVPESRDSADDQIKKQKADMEKNIAEMQKNMAGLDAATRKSLEDAIKQMRKQMEEMEKNPQMMDMMRQGVEMQKAEDQKQYQERMKEWEANFPADPKLLIAKRIREFLETSRDVDFGAKLVPRGDLMVFADNRYEAKSSQWKLCFRAGQEATEAARKFAQTWLAEIGK
jgi:hypothetical protein